VRHGVKPAGECPPPANRAGPPYKNQEGGLKNILCITGVMQRTASDAEHHRPMPDDQSRECLMVVVADKRCEQVCIIGQRPIAAVQRTAKDLHNTVELRVRHVNGRRAKASIYKSLPRLEVVQKFGWAGRERPSGSPKQTKVSGFYSRLGLC